MQYIGLDQHKNFCVIAALARDGEMLDQRKIYHNDPDELKRYLSQVPEGSKLAVEACSFDAWLSDLVEEHGIEVHLANPNKTRAIAEARIKTDELDAKTLAHLLRTDLLCESYHAPKELRQRRYLLRYRQCLVWYRTGIKQRIHALLGRLGIPSLPVTDLFGKRGMTWLNSLQLESHYQTALSGYLNLLEHITDMIKKAEGEIREEIKNDPDAELLKTIPGIGDLSAYLLVVEIGPIERFASAEKLSSYAGLVPRLHQSGQSLYLGRITKQGNKFIRWVLTEAGCTAVRKDPNLARFYQRIVQKKGAQKAQVAVARKLLTYVYHILKKKEPYKPFQSLPNKPVGPRVLAS